MNSIEKETVEQVEEPLELVELGSVSRETKGSMQMVTTEPSILPWRLPWW